MLMNIASAAALVAVLVAVVYQRSLAPAPPAPVVQGRRNTALFIVNPFAGLHNVHMATIQSLRERHPEVELHLASWAPAGEIVKRVTGDDSVIYHELKSQSWSQAIVSATKALSRSFAQWFHPPGFQGARDQAKDMQMFFLPWDGPNYEVVLKEMSELMEAVDPAVTVLEVFLWPAIDAAREAGRVHAFISPNFLLDNFPYEQPWLSAYWKYPPWGSRSPFPIPWSHLPFNMWLAVMNRYWYSWTPLRQATRDYIKSKGLLRHSRSVDWYGYRRDDTPFISQTLPAASLPVSVVPKNVTCVGPMIVQEPPAAEQAPALVAWLARGPTIVINLGNHISYDEKRAVAMSKALAMLMDERPKLQAVWKFKKDRVDYPDEVYQSIIKRHIDDGRLRMVSWLDVNPLCMMQTGHIVASVHHAGAGSYNDALLYVDFSSFLPLLFSSPKTLVPPFCPAAFVVRRSY